MENVGRMIMQKRFFSKAAIKDIAMWNEMIAAYVNDGRIKEALNVLRMMRSNGFKPDAITYNTLLTGYARNGQRSEAYKLLSEMFQIGLKPDIMSFNVLIAGFQQCGLGREALKLFWTMQSPFSCFLHEVLDESILPDSMTIISALAACSDLKRQLQGKEIHGYILRNGFELNVYLSSALVDMYMKCHEVGLANKVFSRIEETNTICWNVLIAGYANNAQPGIALKLFYDMLKEGLQPSGVTFMILLSVCGGMASLKVGRQLHGCIIRSQLVESNKTLANALAGMYAKCEKIKEAKFVYDSELKRNSMIS